MIETDPHSGMEYLNAVSVKTNLDIVCKRHVVNTLSPVVVNLSAHWRPRSRPA
jgi:hypothetical protein